MLIMELRNDQLFGMSVKKLNPWSSILEHALRDRTSSKYFVDHHLVAFARPN